MTDATRLEKLTIDRQWFRDPAGRQITLRGVNFGGDCKVPAEPDGQTHLPSDFADHRTVSFVGRPAPLNELDGHLARIAHWGFNCLRLLTTWEAVEHAGPGRYDERYLDYLTEVCKRAGSHGLYLFVDFHQDVWSRMSGGDGAPGWTFEVAGLDLSRFGRANAAHVMQNCYDPHLGGFQDSYPVMSWSGNYNMPANGIMWTLFLAGADFAPSMQIDGRNIQHYLQDHYLASMRAVAERLVDMPHVLGFDTLNEPGSGYVGRALSQGVWRYRGHGWSPLDGLAVASGIARDVPVLALGGAPSGKLFRANAEGETIWLPGCEDPFRAEGAWDIVGGNPIALREDFFQQVGTRAAAVEQDYLLPLFTRVGQTMRSLRPDWLVFAEINPFSAGRGEPFPEGCPESCVNANHWYDLSALVTKSFDPDRQRDVVTGSVREGRAEIQANYVAGLSRVKNLALSLSAEAPTLIGEFGIQYDMNESEAYHRWSRGERSESIWYAQTAALDLMYNALDELLLSSTQWNYTASNRNDEMIGDGWNQEDLSIWSADQVSDPSDPNSGGRAVLGFCRPFARAVQGTPLRQRFISNNAHFEFDYVADPSVTAPTEIYVPALHFGSNYAVSIDGQVLVERKGQLLLIRASLPGSVRVVIGNDRARLAISEHNRVPMAQSLTE